MTGSTAGGLRVEARQYARLLRRNWLIFLVAVVLCVGVSLLAYRGAPGQYSSTVTFLVQSTPTSSEPSEVYQAELLSQARAQTYVKLATSEEMGRRLRSGLGLPDSATYPQNEIVATSDQGSVLITVGVTDESATRAEGLAQGVEQILPEYVSE